ncbi:MAG: hypothetical protein HQL56_15880 [Magnetococcales bacterium]|nr:hypothetical protein [Magnetococcales bacterium]
MKRLWGWILVLGWCLAPLPGWSAAAEPLEVTSDRLDFDEKQQVAVFKGHVKAREGEMTMTSERLTVRYGQGGKEGKGARIRQLEAEGNVVLLQGEHRGRAETVVYDLEKRTLEMIGKRNNAVVEKDKDRLEGGNILVRLGPNGQVLNMAVKGSEGSRVSARITPPATPEKP